VSMSNAIPMGDEPPSRPSMDSRASRRSFSLGIGKKRSGSVSGSQVSNEKQERRRFSLLPPSFSFKEAVGLGRDSPGSPTSERESQPHLPIQDNRGQRVFTAHGDARGSTPFFDDLPDRTQRQDTANSSPVYHQRHASAQLDNRRPNAIPSYLQTGAHLNTSSDSSVNRPPTEPQMSSYQNAYASSEGYDGRRVGTSRSNKGVLSKNKKFSDYEEQHNRSHEGSSGAARRVMRFFRRRGREDRS
jgi:protein-serine/threonine kinase